MTYRHTLGSYCCAVMSLVFMLISHQSMALSPRDYLSSPQLKDLEYDQQGYLQSTSSDGFLIIDGLNHSRDQLCYLMLAMSFKEPQALPVTFDLFWRTEKQGFSEKFKTFFLVEPITANQDREYVVPLCKLYGFSGNLNNPLLQENITAIRLDFPAQRLLAVKLDSLQFFSADQNKQLTQDNGFTVVQPFERISASAFLSRDVALPKLAFIAEDGFRHLLKDKAFLIFWLLLISALKILWMRSYLNKRDDSR